MNLDLFSDCAFDNKILYFYSVMNGYLGKWDVFGSNQMEYCNLFDEPHNFIRTISNLGKLYSLEASGKALYIFDIDTGKHDMLEIPYNTYEYGNFTDFVNYGNKILIFPKHQSEIMVLDTVSKCIEKVQYDADILKASRCGCIHNNFYFFFSSNGYILRIDLNNYQEQKIKTDEISDELVHCVSYGENIFLLTISGKVFMWDTAKGIMLSVFDFELLFSVYRIAITESKIIVLPWKQRNDIWILDRNTMTSYIYNDYPKDFLYQAADVWNAYEGMTEYEDLYIFAMRSTNYALFINKESGEIQWKRPQNMDGQIMRIMAERGKKLFAEKEENYRLRDYIGYVTAINQFTNYQNGEENRHENYCNVFAAVSSSE